MPFFNTYSGIDSNSLPIIDNELQELNARIVVEYCDFSLPHTRSILNTLEDKGTLKIDNIFSFYQQEKNKDKWVLLYETFEKSFKEKEQLFSNISSDRIYQDFNLSLKEILSLFPNVISVGVSDDECVYIYSEIGTKSIHFDLFFEENEKTEVLVNIFENNHSINSYSDYLSSALFKLKSDIYGIAENEFEYGISGTFVASA